MSSSCESILDHIAGYLKFISKAQSFWFMLNVSYDYGCHLASWFRLEPNDYKVLLVVTGLALYTRLGFAIKPTAWRKFLGGHWFAVDIALLSSNKRRLTLMHTLMGHGRLAAIEGGSWGQQGGGGKARATSKVVNTTINSRWRGRQWMTAMTGEAATAASTLAFYGGNGTAMAASAAETTLKVRAEVMDYFSGQHYLPTEIQTLWMKKNMLGVGRRGTNWSQSPPNLE
jgi:hypothetical protein